MGEEGFPLRLPARPEHLAEARHCVARAVEALGGPGDEARLAVNEALANVVAHAYRSGEAGEFEIDINPDGDDVIVVVRDQGCGPTPNADSAGLGLGLPIIASLARSFEVRGQPEGGTEVRMTFPLR